MVDDLVIEYVALGDVKLHPENPREGDVGAISTSLDRFGQYAPLVVQQSTGHICAGNHRWKAAKQMGWQRVAIVRIDVDDEEALAILVGDNRMSDLASNDDAQLASILVDLSEREGLTGTGYDPDDVDALVERLNGTPVGRDAEHGAGLLAVIVELDDEQAQTDLLDELMARGLNVRAATL